MWAVYAEKSIPHCRSFQGQSRWLGSAEETITPYIEYVTVVAKADPGKSDADIMAAFRSFGALEPTDTAAYRFEWNPILVSFESEVRVGASAAVYSAVTRSGSAWRWTFDSYPFTTGRVLWRVANGLRCLALLTAWTEKGVFTQWLAEYAGKTLAAADGASGSGIAVTDAFANLIAGEAGPAVLAAVRSELSNRVGREDERTGVSERRSSLVASFVTDQLAVRPPISESEIRTLKKQLGID